MDNIKECYLESLISKQNTLIKILNVKCEELEFVLSEFQEPGEKLKGLNSLNASINSTLKLLLQEEKYISEALEKMTAISSKLKFPKPDFPRDNSEIMEKFENWNPQIEIPEDISFKRVYDIPNNSRQ